MTIKELEEFRMICLRGSLARASKELFMSPQGLSRVLKNLENELECTLLDRVASGIELTESGQRLYDYANTVLSEYDKLKKEIDMIRASEEGTVELLVAYDILRYLTPDCILEFQKKYPNVTLSIGPFAGDCFDMKSLKKCSLGLLVYEEHSLAKKREATILDLEGEPLYLENSSFKLNEFIQSRCWNRGFEPDIVFETNGFDLCYKMCRLKRGISVTIDFVHEDMNTEGLVMIPFAEDDMIWEIGLLTLKDRAMESSVEKFYKYIENYNN